MRNVPTLLRRELGSYFASVLGYVVLMFFLVVMGMCFAVVVNYLNGRPSQLTAMEFLFNMFWVPSLVVVPLITMRLLAQEKRDGTMEMLMTAPVTEWEVVCGKYLGAVCLYATMWGLTGLYVLILHHYAGASAKLDVGPILGGYFGVLVIGQFLIAVGLLTSSLTRNQVAAGVMSFAFGFVFLIVMRWLEFMFQTGITGNLVRAVSAFAHMTDFQRGMVDTRPVVLYLSGTALALFLTTRVLESRKWK